MVELTPEQLARIEEILREEERHTLATYTINSKDENVIELLEEAMMVSKIVHGEEIEESRKNRREFLISEQISSIVSANAQVEVLKAQIDMIKAQSEIQSEIQEKRLRAMEEFSIKLNNEHSNKGEDKCDSSEEVAAKSWPQTFLNILMSR